jgi:NAD(P)-dependent dehydrogenase (short-subunit alcohol dehydrogenase family)
MTIEIEVRGSVSEAVAVLGAIDILINNASCQKASMAATKCTVGQRQEA